MKKIFILLCLTIILASCSKKHNRPDSERYMVTPTVEYVKEFSTEINLSNPEKVKTDLIGITGFKIINDSILVASVKGEKGILAFAKTDNMQVLGKFFNIGKGQEELIFPPSLSMDTYFYTKKDSLFVDIYDGQKGRILTVNVSETLRDKKLALKNIQKDISKNIFNFLRISDNQYFCKELTNGETQQKRFLMDSRTRKTTTPSILAQLNTASVAPKEDFNILSTITKMNRNGEIVEMPIGLNYLNIYKLDGSFAKTICIGKELADIDKIMDISRPMRLYTFCDVRVFDKFFGVAQLNEKEIAYQTKRQNFPTILFFSLKGKALAKIKLNHLITSFDIDIKHGYLYTFDSQTEEFLRYRIPKELSKALLDK